MNKDSPTSFTEKRGYIIKNSNTKPEPSPEHRIAAICDICDKLLTFDEYEELPLVHEDCLERIKKQGKMINALIENFENNGKKHGMDSKNYSYKDIVQILRQNLLK